MVKRGEFEDRVREALHREAHAVEPSGDGLRRIQARTAGGTGGTGGTAGRARSRWLAGGTAVLATAAAVAAIAVVGTGVVDLGGEDPAPAGPAETRTVQVFFLDSTPERRGEPGSETVDDPGLYRETHEVSVEGDRVEAAVRELLDGAPKDPDYVNPWQRAGLNSVQVEADRVVVDVTDPPASSTAVDQQLAHTVSRALGRDVDVSVTVQGSPHTDTFPAPPVGTYAGIWVTSPEQGAAVGSPVTFAGMAATFEGNVAYEILRGQQVVARGATISAGGMGVWSEWSFTERLMPGEYTVVAFDEDPALGGRRDVDTKTFTVQ